MDDCDQCGFVYGAVAAEEIAGRLRQLGANVQAVFRGVDMRVVAVRPDPATWSALEYACHTRDVLLVQRDRAVLAQVEECPNFARMHRDERVSLCGYDQHPIEAVLAHVAVAAELCATVFGNLSARAWARRMVYNWPESAERDLLWLGRHTVHEGEHHLKDMRACLLAAAG